jgi:hypothetical protein
MMTLRNACRTLIATCFLFVCAPLWASTGNAAFIGGSYLITPSPGDTTATVQAAGIRNTTASTTTGSLGFELWYSSVPYSGGTIEGFKVASNFLPIGSCTSSQLAPGQTCSAIDVTAALTLPPGGTYYPVLLLVEFSPTCTTNDGYCIDDFVDLKNLVTGGPTVTVGSVNDGGSGTTGNAQMEAPVQVGGIDWNNDTVSISVASVASVSTVESGSLAIQLWFTSSPYQGGAVSGYKVASFPLPASCTVGNAQLDPGMACNTIISGTLTVAPPPSGTYYAAVVLVEYSPSTCPGNAGYCVDNGVALQNQEVVPAPVPVPVTTIPALDPPADGGGGGGSVSTLMIGLLAMLTLARAARSRTTVRNTLLTAHESGHNHSHPRSIGLIAPAKRAGQQDSLVIERQVYKEPDIDHAHAGDNRRREGDCDGEKRQHVT